MEESESKLCLCDSKAWALSKNLREINSSLFSSQMNSEIKEIAILPLYRSYSRNN